MSTESFIRPPTERIYVKVNSDIDKTGYMQPRAVVLDDGRRLVIDQVRDFRPAAAVLPGGKGDCYTVVIGGEEKHLFFERTDPLFHARFGRWFFEETV